jgi:hypothetical protein
MTPQVSVEILPAAAVAVEVVSVDSVRVVEVDRPTAVQVVEVVHPGPQGPPAGLPEIIDGGTFN